MNYKFYEEIENATIVPGNSQCNAEFNTTVYNNDKSLVFSSMRFRGKHLSVFPMKYMAPKKSYLHTAIYLNPWSNAFGHFILETLSRVWLAKINPNLPIIIPILYTQIHPLLLSWQKEILEILDHYCSAKQ